MTEQTQFQKITIKELSNMMRISTKVASQIKNDILENVKPKRTFLIRKDIYEYFGNNG